MKSLLEPELVDLVHTDEKRLIVGRLAVVRGPWSLEREQTIQLKIIAIRNGGDPLGDLNHGDRVHGK
jgi:hypothetical protein